MVAFGLADVMSEIKDVGKLMAARRSKLTDEQYVRLSASTVKSLKFKISALSSLPASDALQLESVVMDTSMSDSEKEMLQQAINDKLIDADHGLQSSSVQKLTPQKLLTPQNYLTQSEWDIMLDDGAAYFKKTTTLVEMIRRVGIRSLHEQTTKACVALLVTLCAEANQQLPPYDKIYDMVLDFKSTFESNQMEPACKVLTSMREFPPSPSQLDRQLFDVVYKDEQPVAKSFIRMAAIVGSHLPIRTTSKLLRGTRHDPSMAKSSAASLPQSQPQLAATGGLQCDPAQMMAQMVAALLGNAQSQGEGGVSAVNPTIFKPKLKLRQPLALQDQADQDAASEQSRFSTPPSSNAASSPAQQQQPQQAEQQQQQQPLQQRQQQQQQKQQPQQQQTPQQHTTTLGAMAGSSGASHDAPPNLFTAGLERDSAKRLTAEDYEMAAFDSIVEGNKKKRRLNKKTAAKQVQVAPSKPASKGNKAKPLGCPKCRYGAGGCLQCKQPHYKPKMTKAQWELRQMKTVGRI